MVYHTMLVIFVGKKNLTLFLHSGRMNSILEDKKRLDPTLNLVDNFVKFEVSFLSWTFKLIRITWFKTTLTIYITDREGCKRSHLKCHHTMSLLVSHGMLHQFYVSSLHPFSNLYLHTFTGRFHPLLLESRLSHIGSRVSFQFLSRWSHWRYLLTCKGLKSLSY